MLENQLSSVAVIPAGSTNMPISRCSNDSAIGGAYVDALVKCGRSIDGVLARSVKARYIDGIQWPI